MMKRHTVDQGMNAARILNMAVSSQLQHQQNFRLHQQRYLAPNPNRKPSEDDLFEMASMLLDPPPPREEEPKATWMDRSTMINSHQSMNNNNNNNNNINHQSSGPYGNNDVDHQMTFRRKTSPTNVSSGDLFDDDELDSVLGDVAQSSKVQHFQTITPETSERTNRETENFLPEITLDEVLQTSNETPTTTKDKTEDQWCLIDFGDDNEEDAGFSSSSTKKRPSLEGYYMDFPFKKTRQ